VADHWHLSCSKSEADKPTFKIEVLVRDGYEDREIGLHRGFGYSVISRPCDITTHLGPVPHSKSHGVNADW
jgi:hypothetical protein